METVGLILRGVGGLGALVCFILILVQMFQRNQSGLGITCIILAFCCGIGSLIAFVYGWINSREWNVMPIMLAWTFCIVLTLIGYALAPVDFSQLQQMQGR